MAGHTKGPWLRDSTTVYALMHAGWRKGVEQFKNRFFCGVYGVRECGDEELEANARLMAAAPDMLEALQAAQAALDHRPNCEDCYGGGEWRNCKEMNRLVERASELGQAAIRRATGE